MVGANGNKIISILTVVELFEPMSSSDWQVFVLNIVHDTSFLEKAPADYGRCLSFTAPTDRTECADKRYG